MEMINENFEPQINSSLSSISNESLEIDFCSISIPLELNEFDNSFKDFFFEQETDMSSFFTSLTESTKDESDDMFHSSKVIIKQVLPNMSENPNHITDNTTTPQIKPTIIHKPVPVRRNKGLYCKSRK
jgi:hypothetical protein